MKAMVSNKVLCMILLVWISVPAFSQCNWYEDNDGDGFGTASAFITAACGTTPAGAYVSNKLDCNDASVNTASWQKVGAGGIASGTVTGTQLLVDANGSPIVLYQHYVGDGLQGVKRYNGTAWETLGTDPISTTDVMLGASIAVDQNGTIYIAYLDDDTGTSNDKATVKRYDEASDTWVLVGNRRFSTEALATDAFIDIQIDEDNVPYVLLLNGSYQATVMAFDDASSTWTAVGPENFTATGSYIARLAIDSQNQVYVAIADAATVELTVMTFDETTSSWGAVGPTAFSDFYVESFYLALDSQDVPYVLYYDFVAGGLLAQQYDEASNTWNDLGALVVNGDAIEYDITIDALGIPYVAYLDGSSKVSVMKWSGATWEVVADDQFALGVSISVAVGPDNMPYVSYKDLGNSDVATVRSVAPDASLPDAPAPSASTTLSCLGDNVTLKVATSAALNDADHWQWYSGSCSGTSLGTGTSISVSPAVGITNYYVRAEGNCLATLPACGNLAITVNESPTISAQPASSVPVCEGEDATITVTASTSNVSYLWQVYNGSAWTDLTTQTNAAISLSAVTSAMDGQLYKVQVTDVSGNCTTASSAATLNVTETPSISSNPVSRQACTLTDATFTVSASGASFQWQVDQGSGWTDLSSQTSASLTLSAITTDMDGFSYQVQVKDASGNCVATSASALLTVDETPEITQQPASVQTCEANDVIFAVMASAASAFQWQVDDGSGFTNLSGQTGSSLTVASVTAGMDGMAYQVLITDVSGNCSVTSSSAGLTVSESATITVQPESVLTCDETDAAFTVSVQALSPAFQWQVNEGTDWEDMPGEESDVLQLSAVTEDMNAWQFRVVITDAGCQATISDEVTLAVNTDPNTPGCNPLALLISEGVSPNGDGNLDYWEIQGIEVFPDNHIKLFNVWGDLIYEQRGYANGPEAWRGQSQASANLGGRQAPDGTYYYLIDLGDHSTPPIKGFVVLKR